MSALRLLTALITITSTHLVAAPAIGQSKPYRLPSVDLKQRVIWGSECVSPDGFGLSFGGQDQQADDGQPHTRILVDGKWVAIHNQLRAANPLQREHDEIWAIRNNLKDLAARTRAAYFEGPGGEPLESESQHVRKIAKRLEAVHASLVKAGEQSQDQSSRRAADLLPAPDSLERWTPWISTDTVDGLDKFVIACEDAAAEIVAEPPPRANSPLVYEPKSKLFVLFGGDHLDYLTNDTWVFDPAAQRWERRHPILSPAPRANHVWKAAGDGTIVLSGGYTYTSSTDYVGGQYRHLDDPEWTYNVAGNGWSRDSAVAGVRRMFDGARTYRTGPFDPKWYYTDVPPPNSKSHAARLNELTPNRWVRMNPPRLPRLNRDWGSAILDPGRDLILRYSGGHSAHGGTDVLHYHLATNRWELTMPVEFPLGQLYANTDYPDGYNFNLRPWITGHTYQNYGYDPISRQMLFTGRPRHTYFYDPDRGDWGARFTKPDSMLYDSCFYTLTLCATPSALYAWTQGGDLLRFDPAGPAWLSVKLTGEMLPGAVVDNSTLTFDSERKRLLFVHKAYGEKATFDGQIYTVDLATGAVSKLTPKHSENAAKIPYLCQLRYDATNDLVLVGGTLPPDEKGMRRTPAYDCLSNAWISLPIGGVDPSDPKGRNVSLGMVYDARRKLFWAVDTNSEVYVLRLSVGFAERQPLQ